jgi:hypothetical protein
MSKVISVSDQVRAKREKEAPLLYTSAEVNNQKRWESYQWREESY